MNMNKRVEKKNELIFIVKNKTTNKVIYSSIKHNDKKLKKLGITKIPGYAGKCDIYAQYLRNISDALQRHANYLDASFINFLNDKPLYDISEEVFSSFPNNGFHIKAMNEIALEDPSNNDFYNPSYWKNLGPCLKQNNNDVLYFYENKTMGGCSTYFNDLSAALCHAVEINNQILPPFFEDKVPVVRDVWEFSVVKK